MSNKLRNRRNNAPCSGFVSMSAIMSAVFRYSTLISPDVILSDIKKYLMAICLVLLLLLLPFSANLIALWLSSYIVAGPTLYPWYSKNCLVHKICPVESDKATNYDSADEVVFSRCIPDLAYTGPLPKVIIAPVWHINCYSS